MWTQFNQKMGMIYRKFRENGELDEKTFDITADTIGFPGVCQGKFPSQQ